ncbi:MAG: hypothetical protein ABI856_12425 [Nitrospira sp.]
MRTVRNISLFAVVASKAAKIRVIAVCVSERKQPHLARVSCYIAWEGMLRQEEWTVALDELEGTGVDLRPRLPMRGERHLTGPTPALARAEPLSEIVVPLELDPLTVADDATFLSRIDKQINLPDFVRGCR